MSVPPLVCTDQDTEEGRYCPACHADWRASEIPRASLEKGYYGHRPPCTKLATWDEGYDPNTPCACPPRFFSRLVGIEDIARDRVGAWGCPACGVTWDRDTLLPKSVPDADFATWVKEHSERASGKV